MFEHVLNVIFLFENPRQDGRPQYIFARALELNHGSFSGPIEEECLICYCDFEEDEALFQGPCCARVSHMECIRTAAYNAGSYFLKCPFCGDKESFVNHFMKYGGIYIPTREPVYEDHDQMIMELDCCYEHCPEPER